MEAYIPRTFSSPKTHKPWFNLDCSRAILVLILLPFPDTHALYMSARNHAKFVIQLSKNSFINRKCQNLSCSNPPRDFWHLAKNISNNFSSSSFPSLLHPDGTPAVSSVSKPELFPHIFADKSTLDDSVFVPSSVRH